MTYRELTRKLKNLGCVFDRQGSGSHEVWINPRTRMRTTIPNWRGRDLRAGTVRGVVRELGLAKDEFDRA
ncbi:MAG: type II toxin-antitoxin system HicA family toxin [Dehalococcoidia bacterium]|nr:type II toxin-antitoxin system HicA family toxin [Dehalococcoidia bacterium]